MELTAEFAQQLIDIAHKSGARDADKLEAETVTSSGEGGSTAEGNKVRDPSNWVAPLLLGLGVAWRRLDKLDRDGRTENPTMQKRQRHRRPNPSQQHLLFLDRHQAVPGQGS